jgi:hypothetical protein
MMVGYLATGQAQTSFDWLNDAATPRDAALANAADIAGIPGPRLLNTEDPPHGIVAFDGDRQLFLAFTRYPADINQEIIQLKVPVGRHNAGLEVRHIGYGAFTAYDENGQENGDYTAADLLVRTHFDYTAGELITLSGAGGYISSHLSDATAQALLWSVRAQLAVFPLNARIGVALQNRGRFIESYGITGDDKLPATMLVGIAKSLAHLPLTLYLTVGENKITSQSIWRIGGEFRISERLALRLGVDQGKMDYQRENAYADLLSGFSIGCGFRTGDADATGIGEHRRTSMMADMAVKLMGPLGVSSSIAVGLEF